MHLQGKAGTLSVNTGSFKYRALTSGKANPYLSTGEYLFFVMGSPLSKPCKINSPSRQWRFTCPLGCSIMHTA